VLYSDPLYPHPDRLAGRALQPGGSSVPTSSSKYAAALLGTIALTTVAGADPYSGINFPVGTTIAGPFEAGFDSMIDTLLSWLGCSPASKGYLVGGTNTQVATEAVAYQCGTTLPEVSGGVFKSLMWSMGVHSPPDSAGCTSPPAGIAGYCTANNPSFHFHQNFTQLYSPSAAGHSTKIGITKPASSAMATSSIYGKYEATGVLPTLDACNAHWGYTPDSPSTLVYHHHVTDAAPFVVGCYGPPASGGLTTLTECRSYYAGCDDVTVSLTTAAGTFRYDTWCPCYDKATGSNLVQYAASSTTGASGNSTSGGSTTSGGSSSASSSNTLAIGLGVGLGVGIPVLAAIAVAVYFATKAPAAGAAVSVKAPAKGAGASV